MLLERNPNARLQVVLGERNYNELQVDNSSLTGESEPQARSPEFTHEVGFPIYSTLNCLGWDKNIKIKFSDLK